MEYALPTISFLLWIAVNAGVPMMLVWGWVRWAKRKPPLTRSAVLAIAGFSLATASAFLAIASTVYARAIGGFPYYDPRLLRIYWCGLLLSVAATVLAIGGLWRPSPLRWHAPVCAFGTLVF